MSNSGSGRRRLGPATLRGQLLVIVLVLVGAALVVSALATTSLLRNYLVGQVDRQLIDVATGPASAPPGGRGGGPSSSIFSNPQQSGGGQTGAGLRPLLPSDLYVQVTAADGTVISSTGTTFATAVPDLPSMTTAQVSNLSGRPFTVGTQGGGGSWRVVVTPTAQGTVTVAQSLSDVDSIVTRLTVLLGVIGLVVLALAGLAATWMVRRRLAPLVSVEEAATAIAAGDLSRRVPDEDPRSEVGQMSVALNTMLGRVEEASVRREEALLSARESEERMRVFVADASHELRTPLTAVRGYAELYRQGAVAPGEVPETFGAVEREADRMTAMVDDLLLLARLDQSRPLDRRPVDVLAVVADVVHSASVTHPDRRVDLTVGESSRAAEVDGDAGRLHQVFGNLLGNALRYSTTEVDVTVGRADDGSVAVVVSDHGPGIPDAEKESVFARFYRSDSARTRSTGGTGLGLSIVAAIVAAHDGSVSIGDTPGGGATFTVTLPGTSRD